MILYNNLIIIAIYALRASTALFDYSIRASMLVFLTVVGATPCLLTFLALWQVKEWRSDRLMDHLRSEGVLRQLFGVLRIPTLAIWYAVAAIGVFSLDTVILGALLTFGALSIAQSILRKQRRPVWTAKAKLIAALSLLLTLLLATDAALSYPLLLAPLVILQPIVVLLVWTILLPVDIFLKQRILRRAALLRSMHPEITVIGITGSVGKTTTKELIACALGDAAIATPAYVNSEIGVARWMIKKLSAISLEQSAAKIFIVEMGAYRTGEIAKLCEGTQPNLGVITFVGSQHIALFGSQERLIRAKAELLKALPSSGRAFLNTDSALTSSMRSQCTCPVTTVSTGGVSDLEAFDIEETAHGIQLRIGTTPLTLPLHGTQNAGNILLAVAVSEHLGLKRNVIANRLARFRPLPGTFTVDNHQGVTVLNDTHNCSPESASAAIRWADAQPASEKILLTSGIIEQGAETERVHKDLGSHSAQIFDRVLFTNKKFAQLFEQGYGKKVEIYSKSSQPVKRGTLLVALGRVSQSAIDHLLP